MRAGSSRRRAVAGRATDRLASFCSALVRMPWTLRDCPETPGLVVQVLLWQSVFQIACKQLDSRIGVRVGARGVVSRRGPDGDGGQRRPKVAGLLAFPKEPC